MAAPVVLVACARYLARPEEPPAPPAPVVREAPPLEAAPISPPAPPVSRPQPRPPLRPLPETLRVGLATDLSAVELPCCETDIEALAGGRSVAVVTALRVEPAAGSAEPGFFRLQVAAFKDPGQAEGLAAELRRRTGGPADVVFDAGTDLFRVRVGRFESREEAEGERRRLAQQNIHDAWVVSEQGVLVDPGLKITQGDGSNRVTGRWLEIRPTAGEGITVEGGRYRGRILIYLNDRGTLNLINEVSLEDYLRGVVPREMGPDSFDNLEALKAQAVAARTYTLANLSEFAEEGYDICATPRCQVYGGLASEHPLTDRAVQETAGEVLLYRGSLVDALYSSTCGGHTEDVEVVFPLKQGPYLRGVPCLENGVDRLAGGAPAGTEPSFWISRRLLPPAGPVASPEDFSSRLRRLAELAGLSAPEDRLASLERREVQRFLGSQFDLALDARLLVAREDAAYLLESPPPEWREQDLRLAAYLVKSGILTGPLGSRLDEAAIEETLFQLALFLRVVERREVRYLSLEDGILEARWKGEVSRYPLASAAATFRRRGESLRAGPLALVPGDRLELFLAGGVPLALVHEADPDGVAFDRTSQLSSWTRFRSDAELADLVRARYPGLEFRWLEILERGVSGRVGKLRLLGEGGRSELVAGLPVRWTLDLPDTLFTARRLNPAGKEPGWLFAGRGWGHGVGMCQVGAYGMSLRGHRYDDILRHYYSGVEIGRLTAAPSAPRPRTGS